MYGVGHDSERRAGPCAGSLLTSNADLGQVTMHDCVVRDSVINPRWPNTTFLKNLLQTSSFKISPKFIC